LRKLTIALILALTVTLLTSPVALAWDVEDPEIYPDAIMEDGETRGYYSLEGVPIYPDSSDYNIYVDTESGSGEFVHVSIGFEDIFHPEVGHDELDTLVRDNDSFAWALGFPDEGSWAGVVYNAGELSMATPSGKNVYQDDGSGKGCFDKVMTWFDQTTYSGEDAFYFDTKAGIYYVIDSPEWVEDVRVRIYSSDYDGAMFYFAQAPRGYNFIIPVAPPEEEEDTGYHSRSAFSRSSFSRTASNTTHTRVSRN